MRHGGRPARPDKPKKRTYYLPIGLAEMLLALMEKRTSRAVTAGIVMFLASSPAAQEEAMNIANSMPPEHAIKEIKRLMPEWTAVPRAAGRLAQLTSKERSHLIQFYKELSPEERTHMMQAARGKTPTRGR